MHEKEGEVKIMAELRTDGQTSACSLSVLVDRSLVSGAGRRLLVDAV